MLQKIDQWLLLLKGWSQTLLVCQMKSGHVLIRLRLPDKASSIAHTNDALP